MKQFKFIGHSADVRLYVEGSTREEFFAAALTGMSQIITPHQCSQDLNEQVEIKVSAPDLTVLLIDFLSDVLTRIQVTKKLFCVVDFIALNDTTLHARLYGHTDEHFEEDIKAVTYHEADVKKNDRGNYETVIIFDV
ncbi:MAG: archease [Candidatus Babeliales bacterium]|jgi:SHS2 domain-containing protein